MKLSSIPSFCSTTRSLRVLEKTLMRPECEAAKVSAVGVPIATMVGDDREIASSTSSTVLFLSAPSLSLGLLAVAVVVAVVVVVAGSNRDMTSASLLRVVALAAPLPHR
jgi:hypothetical protein